MSNAIPFKNTWNFTISFSVPGDSMEEIYWSSASRSSPGLLLFQYLLAWRRRILRSLLAHKTPQFFPDRRLNNNRTFSIYLRSKLEVLFTFFFYISIITEGLGKGKPPKSLFELYNLCVIPDFAYTSCSSIKLPVWNFIFSQLWTPCPRVNRPLRVTQEVPCNQRSTNAPWNAPLRHCKTSPTWCGWVVILVRCTTRSDKLWPVQGLWRDDRSRRGVGKPDRGSWENGRRIGSVWDGWDPRQAIANWGMQFWPIHVTMPA